MISIYNKENTIQLCNEFCEGFIDDDGVKVLGMVDWINRRIKKYLSEDLIMIQNKESIEIIKSFKSLLTNEKIESILSSKPQMLLKLCEEFVEFKEVKIKILKDKKKTEYVTHNLILLIFNYDAFRDITSDNKFGGFLLAKKLGIESCPYCNRNYTSTYASYKKKRIFPEFDHFYHKNKYNLIAVSFYNLIPSCNICNTYFKGRKDSNIHGIFHPYTALPTNYFNFKFIPDDVSSLYGRSDKYLLDFKFNDTSSEVCLKKSIAFFGIKDIYELCHSDLIKEIVNKKLVYSQKYLEIIRDMYDISMEESYRILFETYYEDSEHYKRPFSKLKRDIYDDVTIV